ncbi:FAD-dependent oxidoreductase [Flavivirga jejuensis]|uniref:D-amino-acid oxidase n=1 Tax=Flavivirga jejuensis TaxID=870487 RepID=A0ABT8WQ20_9FLAO|nr:FAD-dependent oxidoreductase [Flavivirga jejuensis]MDO5975260.1 FAD-dependent oxidoreductase [Flavivirga jejuensis]
MKINLPSPNFDFTPNDSKFIAGIRPYREETYRLEKEQINEKLIIHNYGHGGAGVTLSWGCALEVEDLLVGLDSYTNKTNIAIMGCGIMGLTVAIRLLHLGHHVSIYTKKTPPGTTSDVAGGQWNPSTVSFEEKDIERFHRILRRSFRMFESQIGDEYGVSRRTNYVRNNKGSFELVPKDIIPEPKYYSRLPFEGHDMEGYSYETLLIEPYIFLKRLLDEVVRNTITGRSKLIEKTFLNVQDVLDLPEEIVINCSGYGAKAIFNDEKMKPIKGQLALLKAQDLPYLYSGHGYIFPRRDYMVLGGTFEEDIDDPTPEDDACIEIINFHKESFDPKKQHKLPELEERFITDRIL